MVYCVVLGALLLCYFRSLFKIVAKEEAKEKCKVNYAYVAKDTLIDVFLLHTFT